ncbi:hypothetical protein [Actinomadura alba]|uniref:Peptidase inhibitor family I36 n=1 Tax=Actinomadura alba TaxID=406431 RepID=A0ABR7LVN4_9ACTN|nr:hypothetical protein [Actinomadura alba]MBC6468810.1 hypothetical protein [Actinomadura alba]
MPLPVGRALSKAAIIIVASLGALTAALGSAAIADSTSGNYGAECSSSYYCVWTNTYDTGNKASFRYDNPRWSETQYSFITLDDSSSYNETSGGNSVWLVTQMGHYCSRPFAYWRVHNPINAGYGNYWTSSC